MTELLRPAPRTRALSAEFARYLLAGLVNTAVGYGVFLVLLWGAGVEARIANFFSFAVGLLVALLLNRFFVFEGARVSGAAVLRFAAGFGLSYSLNLATLSMLLDRAMPAALAQLVAMAVYTVSFYLINRVWVWRKA